ncbi:MAG: hypothetical protein HKN57_11170 [Xanthomonadales bacterium]|nr:SPOR domain-containing protein [Gammaproteobacteria bacterium]MBT8054709.1 SPOR domain-containing protein [Gammaproteobacteria bacterium]NND57797.1 hypothetical protein [Xanthomonadales bacterium]NNK51446.1 hypothetical protein [Xanthomonadales bacterium]
MDTALKQRLVGASVLIALAVVVLPMLLGGRPDGDSRETQKIELPSQPPELDFETRRYPIGRQDPAPEQDSSQTPAATLPVPEPPSSPEDQQPADQQLTGQPPGDQPAGQEAIVAEPAPDPAVTGEDALQITPLDPARDLPAAAPAAESGGRYLVQVASFGSVQNANRLSDTLTGYGHSVMLDTVKSDIGTLHRVRVGPFASEAEAEAVAGRLQSQVKDIKPRVMDLQPEKAAQVTQPSDPLVRWVVQVGSFSSDSNADRLVARLRLESMSAYKESVSTSGSTTYRVRVGPFLEREAAIRADQLIKQRLSIDGVVMSAD